MFPQFVNLENGAGIRHSSGGKHEIIILPSVFGLVQGSLHPRQQTYAAPITLSVFNVASRSKHSLVERESELLYWGGPEVSNTLEYIII